MNNFRTNAIAGGTMATLLLAGGMLLSIRGFGTLADSQIVFIRAQEQEITLTERLRWSGELLAAAGRNYLFSDDPALLDRLRRIRHEFDESIAALRAGALTARSESLVAAVERDAARFVGISEELAAARSVQGQAPSLIQRFESELPPLQDHLSRSLDDLVEHKQATLEKSYTQARKERDRLAMWMYSLLAILILLGSVITAHFAKQTARAYRKEQDARDVARKAVAARDDLMGMVAHDLRNPLFAVTIQAKSLQRLAQSDVLREQSESIVTLTTRMERLIKSMLDIASLEAGRFVVSPTPCAVDALMSESLTMFELLATGRRIRLVHEIKPAGIVIHADRERVLQLLSNLIGNALKFAPEGSAVTIEIERQQQMVRFAVRDTGQGIRAEDLRHIFDRFWKPQGAKTKGTGLGLFIAKGIVEAHGGQIWVESEPGCGTVFYFTLPSVSAKGTSAPTTTSEYKPNPPLDLATSE
jgi:signal transduction histidine kinase